MKGVDFIQKILVESLLKRKDHFSEQECLRKA
jgi:hypothetical protein